MNDERKNKPSASTMARDKACPGNRQLWARIQAELPALPEPEKPYADSGTRVHSAVEGVEVELDGREELTAEMILAIRDREVERWLDPEECEPNSIKECRLWHPQGTYSGKPDETVYQGERALVMDWKSGYAEVPHAAINLQMRTLAVLEWLNSWGLLEEITVVMATPWIKGQVTRCVYTTKDLLRAEAEIEAIVRATEAPNAPLVPGPDQCKYCPCAQHNRCPALAQVAASAASQAVLPGITIEQAGEFLATVKPLLKTYVDQCEAIVKHALLAGVEVKGWTLADREGARTVTHIGTVQGRFVGAGGSSREFLALATVSLSKLKEAVKEVTGTKGKELEAAMEELTQGCIERKPATKILKRTNGN